MLKYILDSSFSNMHLQECEKEATRNGKLVVTSEECYKVTRTICHEDEQVYFY